MVAVAKLEGDAKIAIETRILDPKAYNANDVVNPTVDLKPKGELQVIVGGVTALQPNFLLAGYGDDRVQTDAAIANLQKILDNVGMRRDGVKVVNAFYTEGTDPEMIKSRIKAHFGNKVQIVTSLVAEACVADATVMLGAEGVAQ
jgi:enamine deaminase RidA (YjgF/YER057c/UK114 family)